MYKSFERSNVMKAIRHDMESIDEFEKQLAHALTGCEIFKVANPHVAYAFNNHDGAFYKLIANADGFSIELLVAENQIEVDADQGIDYGSDADADNHADCDSDGNVDYEPPDCVNANDNDVICF